MNIKRQQQQRLGLQPRLRRLHRFIAAAALTVCFLLPTTGCQLFNQFRGDSDAASPVVFSELPTKDQIVAHLTEHSQRVDQIQTDVKVAVAGLPALRGTLAIERPNRLRLSAGLLGVSELGIDIGSNENVFWIWNKVAAGGQQPAIFYAKHSEYQGNLQQQAIPIEPSWLIDSLGLVNFAPDDRVEGPFQHPNGLIEIRTIKNSAGAQTMRRTVLDPKNGQIKQQAIYDATGKLLAYANSKKYEHYPDYQVSLPGLIEITAYGPDGSEIQLTVNANRFRINSIYGDPEKLWNMPNPGDVPQINLVELSKNQSLRPATGEGASNVRSISSQPSVGVANRSVIRNIR